jgi:hypothetical protein
MRRTLPTGVLLWSLATLNGAMWLQTWQQPPQTHEAMQCPMDHPGDACPMHRRVPAPNAATDCSMSAACTPLQLTVLAAQLQFPPPALAFFVPARVQDAPPQAGERYTHRSPAPLVPPPRS